MPKVEGMVEPYVRGRVRQGTIVAVTAKNQRGVLRGFAESAGCDVRALSERHVRRWLETTEHLAASTRRNRLATVRTFCRWLHEEGLCPRNACRKIRPLREPKRTPKALQPDEVTPIIDACPDRRAMLCVVLLLQLALRRGEAARMQVGDLDLTNRLAVVHGKGGHQRVLYIPDQAHRVIRAYLSETSMIAGPLLRSYQYPNRGLHPDTVSTIVRRAMIAAGVKKAPRDGVCPHALRHTGLTDMLRNGAHVRDVQAVAGHAHLTTTETYLPLLVGTLSGAMEGRWYGGGGMLPAQRFGGQERLPW